MAQESSADSTRRHSQPGDEGGAPRQPALLRRRLELARKPLPEGRRHPLRTLVGRRKSRGHDDGLLLLGVPASELQPAAVQQVADDALDAVLALVTHRGAPWPPRAGRAAASPSPLRRSIAFRRPLPSVNTHAGNAAPAPAGSCPTARPGFASPARPIPPSTARASPWPGRRAA